MASVLLAYPSTLIKYWSHLGSTLLSSGNLNVYALLSNCFSDSVTGAFMNSTFVCLGYPYRYLMSQRVSRSAM